MLKILLIFTGGGLGAAFRHLVFTTVQGHTGSHFPGGTLTVNLIGSFLIGLLWHLLEGAKINPDIRLLIFTGFLGGFTTFSTFARETMQLIKIGEWKTALTYIGVSNILGILLVFAGYSVAKSLLLTLKN